MRTLELREHATTCGVRLTVAELALLRAAVPSVAVRPAASAAGRWDLTPSAIVGSVVVGSVGATPKTEGRLRVEIRPKLQIDRLLFLIAYSANPQHWRDHLSAFGEREDLMEALASVFVRLLQPVVHGGLLQGYVSRDEALNGIRGRIRFEDQVRRHGNRWLPVEVRYDDFTLDILENRLLAAAVDRLRRLPLRHTSVRRSLRVLGEALVTVTRPRWRATGIPRVAWTRLNRRYRAAVEMAQRILRACSFDLGGSSVRASGLLLDMNRLFEDFVTVALREDLGLDERSFPPECRGRRLMFDAEGRLPMQPDLSWWQDEQCVFVGDIKYKRASELGNRPDLYQLLAYALTTRLNDGLLIYGDLTGRWQVHQVSRGAVCLHLAGISLDRAPGEVLAQVSALAGLVRTIRDRAARHTFGMNSTPRHQAAASAPVLKEETG